MKLAVACIALCSLCAGCAPYALRTPGPDAELQSAIESAHRARIDGPALVRIALRTELRLEAGFVYIPPAQGERLLRAMGKRPAKEILGVVISAAPDRTDLAVLVARGERIAGIPDLGVEGWSAAPALAGLRQR